MMSINEAQGPSVNNLGAYFPQPVFSHGQLYVALSVAGFPHKTEITIISVEGTQGLLGKLSW